MTYYICYVITYAGNFKEIIFNCLCSSSIFFEKYPALRNDHER